MVRPLWGELRFRPPYSPSIGRAGQLGEDRRAPSARQPGRLKHANAWSLVSRLWRIAGSSPPDVPGRSRGRPPVRTGEARQAAETMTFLRLVVAFVIVAAPLVGGTYPDHVAGADPAPAPDDVTLPGRRQPPRCSVRHARTATHPRPFGRCDGPRLAASGPSAMGRSRRTPLRTR